MSIFPGLPDSVAHPNRFAKFIPDSGAQFELNINPVLMSVFRTLEDTGQSWILLRGEDDLMHPAGDVDLLVSRKLLPRLDRVLEAAGFRRVMAQGHGSHRFYFCYLPNEDSWIKLDIVSDIAFGKFQELRTGLAADCLRRRVAHGPLWLPELRDKAWLQILHLVLDKGHIAPERVPVALWATAVASASDPVADFLDRKFGKGKAQDLLDLLGSGNFQDVPAAAASLSGNWTRNTSAPKMISVTHRVLRRVGPYLKGRGPVIGVLAPDGAGKTTLLVELQSHSPLPSTYVYMGLWSGSRHDPWVRRVPGAVVARKVFRILRGSLTARYVSFRGRLVLMDRLAEDTLLASPETKSRLGALTDALALRLQPTPDLVLVLDAPGELMFKRKGEHSPQILEEWRAAYLELAGNLPTARIVDASRSASEVRKEASSLMWRTLVGEEAADPVEPARLPLHLWTLLDWRFLLPVAQCGRVGYGGQIGPDTAASLTLLDPGATRIAMDGSTGAVEFDLVLLSQPDLLLVEKGIRSLSADGWICLQVKRKFTLGRGPHTLGGWKRALERAGFDEVEIHWLVPTLEHPERLVPTASETAVRNTIAHYSSARFGKAKAPVARLALRLGLFNIAAPAGIVIGRRVEEAGHQESA